MKQSIFSLVLCLLLFSVAIDANILPIVNTTSVCSSKSPCELRWTEDGTPPKLAELPTVNIKLMTGPNDKQIEVMDLATVSALVGKINYKIPPTLGPPGRYYFYKFTSGPVEVWSTRMVIQNIQGTIPGFDPKTINAKGNTIEDPGKSTNSSQLATSASSSILFANTITTFTIMGLSIISMVVISYLC